MDMKIRKQWDSTDIDHAPVEIKLDWNKGDDFLTLHFNGPFFDDPKAPTGKAGEPFPELWEYEGKFISFFYYYLVKTETISGITKIFSARGNNRDGYFWLFLMLYRVSKRFWIPATV